jgi:hypothetical protein
MSLSRLSRTNGSLKALHCYVKNSVDAQGKGRLRCLFVVTGGPRRARPRRRASSFHDLSVGEALAPDLEDRENSGGGKFPSQISHRKDQHGSLGIEEKISQSSRKKC